MWLWTVLLAAALGSSAAVCPDSCYCHHEQGLLVADCSSLPTMGGKLESLNLERLDDTPMELIDGQFSSARQLKYLSLRNASIKYIHKKAFYGAKNIIEIDLSYNYLEKLEPTLFQHLTSLTTLSLRGNLIHFTSEMPFLISNSLQHLDIGQCKLRSLPRGVFYGLKRLRYLSVDGNFLKTLKYNSLPKGLKTLDLSNNLIINVPTEVISSLTNLRKINLGGNPINCSCSLLNLQDWLSGRGVISIDTVTCSSPAEYYGISWSKVDEKRVCLAEVRRVQESYNNHPLFKNGFYRDHYLSDDSYLGESLQADQPEPDAEIMFQNNDTIAMGHSMRDVVEEESEKRDEDKQLPPVDIESEDLGISKESDSTENKMEESDKANDDLKPENSDPHLKNDDSGLKENETDELGQKNDEVKLENNDHDTNDKTNSKNTEVSEGENIIEDDKVLEPRSENSANDIKEIMESDSKSTSSVVNKEDHLEEIEGSGDGGLELGLLNSSTESTIVEFTNDGEDTHSDTEDLVEEGLIRVNTSDVTPSVNINVLSEGTTDLPDMEDTTKEITTTESVLDVISLDNPELTTEIFSSTTTEVPAIVINTGMKNEEEGQNSAEEERIEEQSTVSPSILIPDLPRSSDINNNINELLNNGTESNFEIENGEEPSKISEEDTIPPPVLIPDLSSPPDVKINTSESINTTRSKPDNGLADDVNQNNGSIVMQPPVKEVAGAEVVLFCIAVIVICLILFSVYKCRTRSKEPNTRTVVDLESSKGTEMQDLLPKPQGEEKKNNLKYRDEVPLDENVKLLTEHNENESPNFTPVAVPTNKLDDKNSLNNNTANGTNSKKPEIKSETAVPDHRANPASPIQRTKAKVGIIPDSIPRTPILIQKSYNGTSNKL